MGATEMVNEKMSDRISVVLVFVENSTAKKYKRGKIFYPRSFGIERRRKFRLLNSQSSLPLKGTARIPGSGLTRKARAREPGRAAKTQQSDSVQRSAGQGQHAQTRKECIKFIVSKTLCQRRALFRNQRESAPQLPVAGDDIVDSRH